MKDENIESEQDEIVNPEQFQVGRAPEEEKAESEDSEYTEDEIEFADGEGTQLEAEFDEVEEDDDDIQAEEN